MMVVVNGRDLIEAARVLVMEMDDHGQADRSDGEIEWHDVAASELRETIDLATERFREPFGVHAAIEDLAGEVKDEATVAGWTMQTSRSATRTLRASRALARSCPTLRTRVA